MIRFMTSTALGAALLLAAPAALAEPVSLEHEGLRLNGNLELANGRSLGDGVVLLVHGTLAHHGMELIAGLQDSLAERGLNSLAVSLSLGINDRSGLLECDATLLHTHRHADAAEEIGAWVGWLDGQGAGPLAVFGHSRGGAQVAWFATEHAAAARVDRWVLAAPATWTAEGAAASYATRFGVDLDPLLETARGHVAAGAPQAEMTVPGFIYCPDARVTAAAFLGYYEPEPRFDTPTLLPAMPGPTLVVVAAGDDVVADLPERLAAVEAKGLRVETVPEADHMFLDFAALDLADVVADFLAP